MRLIALCLALLLTLPLAPVRAGELTLGAWNIAWLTLRASSDPALPDDVQRRRPADFDRLRQHAARLGADVIAFQEVDGEEAARRVFPADAWNIALTDEDDIQRPGFAIRRGLRFTRNPDLAALDLNPESRHSLRKGADITLELDGGSRLRLLSVHLKAGCSSGRLDDGDRDCETLAQQIPALAGWIAQRRQEGVPFMIMGDFNRRLNPRDAVLNRLESAAPLLHVNGGVSSPCWARGDGRGRPFIDHILAGGAARGWVVPGSFKVAVFPEQDPRMRQRLSDHCPILVTLQTP
ncbi:endonuclease/exonuclease/phosphatase family protein [Acetobacteraceae bacterium H6797]|nr:endonuclease/exonuclease/phosphatase family protein [Acetobacteraceae bacterium H6797]